MPPEVKNGKVTLETDKSLPLYGQKRPTLKRQASVIKATQEGDEKKFIFQVTRPTLHTHINNTQHTHTTHNIHQTKKQYTHYHEGQTGGEKFVFQVTLLPLPSPPYTYINNTQHTNTQHTTHQTKKQYSHLSSRSNRGGGDEKKLTFPVNHLVVYELFRKTNTYPMYTMHASFNASDKMVEYK